MQEFVDRLILHLPPGVLQRFFERLHHGIVIAMRAAQWLSDDFVDQAQRLETGCRNAERLGRLGRVARVLPQD